jgi:hypothetical protein
VGPNPTEPESKLSLYYHPHRYKINNMDLLSVARENNEQQKEITQQQSSLYSFMYALKSSEARRQYPKRLKMLFDYLKLSGSLEEQATAFINMANSSENGHQWAQNSIMAFLAKNLLQVLLRITIELLNYFVK